LQEALNDAITNRENAGWLALIGLVTLVFSASSAFSTLDKAVNRAWNSEKVPSFIVEKLVSFAMMAATSLLLLLSVLASTFMTAARAATTAAFGEVPGSAIFWWLVNVALSLALIFGIFILIYRFLPRFEVILKDVWLGALLAAIAWVILKELFALYLGSSLVNYSATYGNIGTVIILLTWIYLSALIILTGAEFTAETYKVRRLRAEMMLQSHSEHGERGERGEHREGGEGEPRGSPWFSAR
jgi:membrane protein